MRFDGSPLCCWQFDHTIKSYHGIRPSANCWCFQHVCIEHIVSQASRGNCPKNLARLPPAGLLSVTDRAGIEPQVARSTVQRLNHLAIKVPERPSRLGLTGSLHYPHYPSPTFWNPSPLARATFNQGGELPLRQTQATTATSVTGPCGDQTLGRSLHSPTPKPLGHKGDPVAYTWLVRYISMPSARCSG